MPEQIQQIDYAIVPKTHPSIYLMHKYWARKPHNVVAEYIRHYTKESDIVLDPFCGSGVTVIEALRLSRKAIGVDLDPVATFITKCTSMQIDLEEFERTFKEIKNKVRDKVFSLYKTHCIKCKKEAFAEAIVWSKEKPTEIRYSCKCSKDILWKDADKDDLTHLQKIENLKIPFWYPKNELIWNTRVNVHKGTKVNDLFTKRNLFGLSIILNEIESIKKNGIKELLKFTFSSSVPQASKLVFVIRQRGRESGKIKKSKRPEVGSWATRGYWIGEEFFEINAWNCFEQRFNKILRGKTESNEVIGKFFKEGKKFEDLLKDANVLILNQSALDLHLIPSNSVDYVFTDPPYGDSVPYLELDYMWASWLRFEPNFDEEIIISNSPVRNKRSEEEYARMLTQAFKEVFRVLKPNHYCTVTFHNADVGVYNSVIKSIVLTGFELDKILYQPPSRPSAKTLLAPYGSAEGDYYIRFKKPDISRQSANEKHVDMLRFEKIVIQAVKEIIAERGEPVTYNDILKSIYIELDKEGYLNIAKTEDIEKILNRYKDKEFVFIKGSGWWFKNPEKYFLHITPLQDRVETFVVQTLRKKFKASFDEILQDIFIELKNALTPEPTKVKAILMEYAKPTKDKKWQLKPSVEIRIKEHNQVIGFLAEIGKKLGFKIHIGLREQGEIYEGKPLSNLLDTIKISLSKPIKEIDILWIKDNKIAYAFDVEYTTGITEAIVRGSYIPSVRDVKRILVIPEEREKLLYKKVNAPVLKDRVEEYGWRFMFFKDLKGFFEWSKHKKELDVEKFEEIIKALKPERERQLTLSEIK